MMSKDKQQEDILWKDVEEDQSIKRGGKVIPYGERRKAPFFKVRLTLPTFLCDSTPRRADARPSSVSFVC